MAKRKTSDAVKILHGRYIKNHPKRIESLKGERQKADIASQIYELRTRAGVSQKELAKLVKTTQSVISRLESADYRGHSLDMLRRIAAALHYRLKIKLVPQKTYAHAV